MKIRKACLIVSAAFALCGCSIDGETIDELLDEAELWQYGEQTGEVLPQNKEETKQTASTEPQSAETEETVDYSCEITYSFRSEENLQQHFEKHGAEFGYLSEQEYVEGANSVIVSADSLHKTEAEDGDDIYYLEETNEFVVVSTDGYIRTYFKPSRGIDYYYDQ